MTLSMEAQAILDIRAPKPAKVFVFFFGVPAESCPEYRSRVRRTIRVPGSTLVAACGSPFCRAIGSKQPLTFHCNYSRWLSAGTATPASSPSALRAVHECFIRIKNLQSMVELSCGKVENRKPGRAGLHSSAAGAAGFCWARSQPRRNSMADGEHNAAQEIQTLRGKVAMFERSTP